MPNYDFKDQADETIARRVFRIKAVFMCGACFALVGPILLVAAGRGDKEFAESDTWVSVQILDKPSFRDISNPFVCQSPRVAGGCAANSVANLNGTLCFAFHKHRETREKAKEKCKEDSGVLVTIVSAEDNKQVHDFCKDDSPCWIGLERAAGALEWKWMDGTPLSYKNWDWVHSNPNERKFEPDEGSFAVFGYKRRAGDAMVIVGLSAIYLISLDLAFLTIMCYVTHTALKAKRGERLCCVGACDGIQALYLLLILGLMNASVVEAEGASINRIGSVLVIVSVPLQLILASYSVYGSCTLRYSMDVVGKSGETE